MGTKLGTFSSTRKDHSEMYPPGLELHGSAWRIKKRIPKDLLEHYKPASFLRHNAGTGDRKAAAVIAWQCLADWEEEFGRLRKTGSKLKRTLGADEVGHLVALMVRSSLAADEEARALGVYADDASYEQALAQLSDIEAEGRTAVSRRIFGESVSVAKDWLWGHGYDILNRPDFRGGQMV